MIRGGTCPAPWGLVMGYEHGDKDMEAEGWVDTGRTWMMGCAGLGGEKGGRFFG